jgi:hypothetical protein
MATLLGNPHALSTKVEVIKGILEQVYREINVTMVNNVMLKYLVVIIAYLTFVCLQNGSEESIRHKNEDIF